MASFFTVDWAKLFVPDKPLLEIFMRGTLVYLGLFIMLRVVLKRESGAVSLTDLLVVALMSNAAQNAMASNYDSVADGLFLVMTILWWAYVLHWLSYHSALFSRLMHATPLPLIQGGKLLYRNMRREFITEEELRSQLRQQGLTDFDQVKEAYMEGDGHISIIGVEQKTQGKQDRDRVV